MAGEPNRMRFIQLRSVRARLVLLVAIALLPGPALILRDYVEYRHLNDDGTRTDAVAVAGMVSVAQETTIEDARLLVASLQHLPAVQRGDTAECGRLFEDMLRQFPAYTCLAVANADGVVISSSTHLAEHVDVARSEWFSRVARTLEPEVGTATGSLVRHRRSLVVASPILAASGHLKYVVVAALDLSWLNTLANDAHLAPGSTLYTIDSDGEVLVRQPDALGPVVQRIQDAPPIAEILRRDTWGTTVTVGADGISRLWAYAPVHAAGKPVAFVGVTVPSAMAFTGVTQTQKRSLVVLALLYGAAVLLTAVLSEAMFARPVRALTQAAGALASGDLEARTGLPYGPTEVGQLASAFDGMAASLQSNQAAILSAQSDLAASEERFRRIFEGVSIGLNLRTLDGRSVQVNPALCRILGYTESEMATKAISDVVRHEDAARVCEAVAQVNAGAMPEYTTEVQFVRKDGVFGWAHVTYALLRDAGGDVLYGLSIVEDITEHKAADQRVLDTNEQLHALAQRLHTIREEQRKALAREVHDVVGQALTGIRMDVAWMRSRAGRHANCSGPCPLMSRLDSMPDVLSGTIDTVRTIADELRPSVLDTLGLVSALRWQARVYQERTGVPCEVTSSVESIDLCDTCKTAVFRIFQEALTNIARHAEATHIQVRLEQEADRMILNVIDNGVGMPESVSAWDRSLGIVGMRERAEVFGGDVIFSSTPGHGTRVSIVFPVRCRDLPVVGLAPAALS